MEFTWTRRKIKKVSPRTTSKELGSFLGLASHYRRFIPGFENTSKPINAKTSEKVTFVWTEEMQKSFDALKLKLVTSPVSAYPDYQKYFLVCNNASNDVIRAFLSQLYDNEMEHPIHYASRELYDFESKYSAFEREVIWLIFALKKFRDYVISNKFKLYTDHQALKHVFNMKDPNGRMARWVYNNSRRAR